MRLLLPLLLLPGCWLSQTELEGKIADGPSDTGDVQLDPLVFGGTEPGFGPTSGGTEVTLTVGPLASDNPAVHFGSEAAAVVSASEDEIVVLAPAASTAGPVAVTVADSGREISSAGAYTYHLDQSGLTGVLGEMTYVTYVGDAWGTQIERPPDFGYGWVSFIQPMDVAYSDLFHDGTVDTCARSYTFGGTLVDRPVGASSLTVSSGATSLDFAWNSSSLEFERDLTIAEFRPGSSFDLQPLDSTTFPAFEVEGFAHTPLPFQVTQPEFDTFVSSSFDVSWTTAEQGAYVLLDIDLWSDSGGGFVESVDCLVADDGSFRVQSSEFTQWAPFDTTVRLGVGRVITSDAVLAHDHSASGVVGTYWVYGLAYGDL